MEATDRALLNEIQQRFPLEARPYAALAQRLSLSEEEVLARLLNLKREGILRQISAIFNPAALGYRTTLVAAAVSEEKLSQAAETINSYPGVSHNYLRDHFFNLWFTIAVPPGEDLKETVANLLARAEVEKYLLLPIKRVFHIAAVYVLGEDGGESQDLEVKTSFSRVSPPDPRTITLVRLTQEDLPLCPRPFQEIARKAGLQEEEVLSWLKEGLSRGIIRRFAGLIRHTRAGLKGNIMVAWQVPPGRIEEVGKFLAREKKITHCYERKSYPEWPYNLYTMVHARDETEARKTVADLATRLEIPAYLPLKTVKELKKIRLKLFW